MNNLNTAPVSPGDPAFNVPAPPKESVPPKDVAPAKDAPAVKDEAPEQSKSTTVLAAQADFRLVIEEDSSGAFVYKTMDRRTGEVIQQFPREQILRLRESEQYTAGSVVNARA
ncbi:MAG: hypothetical protein EON94_12185 [Caulobacteraceae bacterium]|nr:MAG: hypothetical protein EON94_12185 [Caulobacteraceae bacterium]